MSRFWTSPKRIYRLHRVCWGAYKRCWNGGRSPVMSSLADIKIVEKDWMPKDEFMLVSVQPPQPIDRTKE